MAQWWRWYMHLSPDIFPIPCGECREWPTLSYALRLSCQHLSLLSDSYILHLYQIEMTRQLEYAASLLPTTLNLPDRRFRYFKWKTQIKYHRSSFYQSSFELCQFIRMKHGQALLSLLSD